MKYFIGADLGTSALKLLLTDENKNIVKTVTKEYTVHYPHPGWSQQNPEDWWQAFVCGVKELTEGIKGVCAVAVSGQMHGLVTLDAQDNVIRPAILWNDGRTHLETKYLNETIGTEKLARLTGNIAFAGFTAPKILWMAKNEPENFARISKIMLPKDYINYKLTGIHSCDYSDASGMLLLDVKNKCWSEEMLRICNLKEAQLPQLFESYEPIGNILPFVLEELGLEGEIIVAAGAGDNAGAALGTATVGDGNCNISLGTSGTVFISSKKYCNTPNNAIHSFCHSDGGFHLMGCILSAASCNKWFCDEVLKEKDYSALQAEIPSELPGHNDVYFLPYLMGERTPVNDTNATGMFIGLRPDTSREKMLLSILEGVAFAIRDSVEIARDLGIEIKSSTVCGGGAKSPLWMKILCNVLGIELNLPETEEGPGFGASLLAMVACGQYSSVEDCVGISIKETLTPDPKLTEKYNAKYEKYKKIYPSVKDLFANLKGEEK